MKIALILALFCAPAAARAATNAAEAHAEYGSSVSSSYKTLAVFMANNFQKSAGFTAGSHAFSPPDARKKLGFNVGVMGGATFSKMDKKAASAGLADADTVKFVDTMPDLIPMGQGGLNIHVGVPSFFVFESVDLGLRSMVFNGEVNDGKGFAVGTEQQDYGFDFKGNVFESGLVSPVTLTLGLSVDSYKSKVWLKQSDLALNTTGIAGYTGSGKISNELATTMTDMAYQLRAVVSRKLLFFVPYLGVAAQINSGSAESRGVMGGDLTFTGPGLPSTYTAPATAEGKATAPISGMDVRLGGGFEFSFPFFYVAVNGEYGAISGGSGASIQLGSQFR